jgi:hypothetical protein
MNGVPLAVLPELVPVLAPLLAAPVAAAAGAVVELDDEDEQPAAASAATAIAVSTAAVDLPARVRSVSFRVIFASFFCPGTGPALAVNRMFRYCRT